MTLIDLLQIPYRDGGRDATGCDCWGLARLARHHLFGKPLLPEIAGQYEGKPRAITGQYQTQAERMRRVSSPVPGAIIAVKRGPICFHVALMLDDGHVLETLQGTAPRRIPWSVFSRAYRVNQLEFYCD